MGVTNFSSAVHGGFHIVAVVVLSCLLEGCTSAASRTQTGRADAAGDGAFRSVRAIIYFKHSLPDIKQVSAAVSEACHCQPQFVSAYSADSVIYRISLPQGERFDVFEKALMRDAAGLGIRVVEQDSVRQPQ